MEGNLPFKINCTSLQLDHFCFVLCCIRGQIPSTSLRGLIFEGAIQQRVFCIMSIGGGLYLEGLIHGEAYLRNFTVFKLVMSGVMLTAKSS